MRNRGFTLLELLVVIAIIAVLMGILMPVVTRVKESANATACVHNMRQIGVAALSAATDNNNKMIGWYNYSAGTYWWQTLQPYMATSGTWQGQYQSTIFRCPSDTNFDPNNVAQTVSYGWNYMVIGRSDTDTAPVNLLPLGNFTKPAETLVLTDSAPPQSWGYIDPYGHSPDPLRHHGKTNALFLDGHVESIDVTTVATPEPYLDRSAVTN
jgi:prepilin-type N-terminal cleavage/methylation domain-containing protein/prepilin-type processing-associated H-X9-DG protein